jgi:hypothetical protein
MSHWPDRTAREQPPDHDRDAPRPGSADRDVSAPRKGPAEEDWESLWIDLGGEG